MKTILIILILLLPVFLQAMPYASAHGVCGGLQPRYVHLEHTTLSKQTLQTGENFTITGNMTALTGNDLKGKLFLQTKPSPHGRLVVSSIEPSSGIFDIPGNSTIPYSITVTALLPGNYFVSSGLDLIGIGPSLINNGCSNTIEPNLTVTGSPICIQGLVAVTKAEDGSSACVKPDTAQKLIDRGWAKEIVPSIPIMKTLQTKNQIISIGNDTYDTIEFQTMTANTVSLDNVKFTYQGASPLNNNCYPDLTNQTEAKDFEMIPGNISDMHTHQCWPPSNYPQKITKETVIPSDLFLRYSINFFDYNQTIGVGWCHSGSCDLGQTFYLVKSGWNAPVTYDDPVSLLEFHLGTNASVISSGQAIGIDMSTSNKLPRTILVPSEYNYSFKGTGLGPCTYGPFDLAILEGFYGENNFTHGNDLSLYQPGIYSCPALVAPQSYKFEPMSDNAVGRCEPFDGCISTGQIQFHTSFSGIWNDTSFHKFESGLYTIIGGDEWGHVAILHFTVTNSTRS